MGVSTAGGVLDQVIAELMPRYAEPHIRNYLAVHAHRYKTDLANICSLVPEGSKIFDFGAYPYVTSEALARLGYDVTAADIDPSACPFRDELSFPIIACNANAPHIPIDDEVFDAVVLTEVFEHLHMNPIRTMRELFRILKTGGALYLTTPNGIGLRKLVKVMISRKFQDVYHQWSRLEASGLMGHVTEYTPAEIRDFLEKIGFKDVVITTKNVYKKPNRIEHYFWKAASFPLLGMRETIIAVGRK